MFVHDSGSGIECILGYNTDLFAENTAKTILESFGTLVANIVAQPDAALSTLSLLGSDQPVDAACSRLIQFCAALDGVTITALSEIAHPS